MALAQRRISVVVEGSSASLQTAIDKAVSSLRALGDVAAKQSQAAIGWNDRVIASNKQLMASYARMAEAVKGSAGIVTNAVKIERDAQVGLAGATDKATKSVVTAAQKQAGAYRDAGTVIDRSAKVQRDAIASVATAANRSAGDVIAASERSAAAQRTAADASVASSRRSADGHVATAATATKSFASSGSALVRFGKLATEATAAVGLGSLYMAGKFEASSLRLLTQAGASTKEVKVLQRGMLDLAGSLGQTPQHLSEGLYHVVSSMEAILPPAHRTEDELKIMAVAAQEAAIGNTNMEETSYALASAMNALHAPASQAKNVMAEMNAIVGSGDMTMQDLLDALRSGLIPTARTFGVSFRSVGAALAVMGDLGMRGALAGTRLRMSLALLAAPSDKAAKMLTAIGMGAGEVHARTTAMSEALEKAGLTTTTMAEDLKKPNGIAVAFRDLQDHLRKAGLSSTDAAALMSRAFGGGRMGATIQLLEQQVGRLEAKYKQTGELTHKWGEDVAKTHETLAFQAKQAGAAVEALGIKIGHDLTPYAKTALHDLEELAKFFEHNEAAAKALAITLTAVLGVAMTAFVANRIAKMVEGLKQVGALMTWLRNGFSSTALAGAASREAGVVSTVARTEAPIASAFTPGVIFGARGPEAPGSLTNPIVVAVESGTFAGLGSRAAAIGASPATAVAENAALGAEARTVPTLPGEARTPGGLIIPGNAASRDLAAASGVTPAVVAGRRAAATTAVTTAERSTSASVLSSVRTGLGGVMANAMKGGMIGLGGIFASELVGAAIGGKTGHEISGVLKDASVGGAIGYAAAGPMGAAVGAAGGALLASIKALKPASPAEKRADNVTHPPGTYALPEAVRQAVNREKTKEEKELERLQPEHFHSASKKIEEETPSPRTAEERARARQIHNYYESRIGAITGQGFEEKRLQGGRNPGLEELVREAKAHLKTLEPVGQVAMMGFVRRMVQTLEHEGRLLPGSLKRMLDQLQPLLKGALPFAAGESAKNFHERFMANLHTQDMVNRISETAKKITGNWSQEFGLLPISTDMTFSEITQHANHDLGVLEHIMKTGTQQQREEAEKEYKLLAPGLKGYMAAAAREVETELKALSHLTGPEAGRATAAIVKKWEALPHGVKAQVDKTGGEVKKGLEKMTKETEGDLKGLGITTVGGATVHISGSGQLHGGRARGGLIQLGRRGEAGRDTIPLHVGGMNIVAAPGEKVAVFTRHQETVANRELSHMGGLPGLFSKVNQPNYMAQGGFVPSQAYPGPRGRIDQGVDYAGPGPVRAVLDGIVKSVGLWPGWPGSGGIVYNTARGVVYVMENFAPAAGMRSGRHLKAGEVIGQDTGGAYGIETGWADAGGTAPIIRYGTAPDGTPMPGGKAFASFLGGGPGGGIGGVATNIVAPKIKAPGLIGHYAQNLLRKYASIANAAVSAAGGAGGPSFGAPDTSHLPAAARTRLNRIASERSWNVNDWLAVIGLESGGNPAARNPSGAYGIGQALGSTQREYPKMVSSNPAVQIEGMAEYISSRYKTPTAALAHEHAFHWYERGGFAELSHAGTHASNAPRGLPTNAKGGKKHGGIDIAAAPSEKVAVFTRHQEARANHELAHIGGLPGLFSHHVKKAAKKAAKGPSFGTHAVAASSSPLHPSAKQHLSEPMPAGLVDERYRAARPGAKERGTFQSLAQRAWSRLSGASALPPGHSSPVFHIIPEGQAKEGRPYTLLGTPNVFFPYSAVNAAIAPANAYSEWARNAIVHEIAHTMQTRGMPRFPEAEGGATAWASLFTPRVFGFPWSGMGGAYAPYERWVWENRGMPWVRHRQFGEGTGSHGRHLASGGVIGAAEPIATAARSKSGLYGNTTIAVTGTGTGSRTKKTPKVNPKITRQKTHKPKIKGTGKGKNLAGFLRNLAGIPDLEKLPDILAPDETILGALGNMMSLVKTIEGDPKGPVILQSDLQYIPALVAHGVHANMPTEDAYHTYEDLLSSKGESPQLHLEGEMVKWAEGQADHRLLTGTQASILAPAGKALHWSPKAGTAMLQVEEDIEVLEQNHNEAEERHLGGVLFTLQRRLAERKAREKRLKHLKHVTEKREKHIQADLRHLATGSLKQRVAAAEDGAAQSERVQDAIEHQDAVHELVVDISSIPSAQRTKAQERELPPLKQEEARLKTYLATVRNPVASKKEAESRARLAVLKNRLENELPPLRERMKAVNSSELGVGIRGVQSEIKTIVRDEPAVEEKMGEITGVKLPVIALNLEEIARSMQEAELPKLIPGTAATSEDAKTQELLNLQKQINAQLAVALAVSEAQFATLKNFAINVPHFDKGGPVLEDGLAYVHRGEHVVPRDGALIHAPSNSPIHVNVQNHVQGEIAPLVALIDSRVSHPSNVAAISQHMQRRVYNLPGYR